ncbi:hypothetical protein B0H11DRAFT_271379 [Mycena galericulata]|nr:hypothetical protein B0H11DRAFT_271379 [Mycena galericulata]
MRLILSNHKPCHAIYKDAVTGVVQYKVRSPIKVSEFISTITRRIDVDIPRRNSGHSQCNALRRTGGRSGDVLSKGESALVWVASRHIHGKGWEGVQVVLHHVYHTSKFSCWTRPLISVNLHKLLPLAQGKRRLRHSRRRIPRAKSRPHFQETGALSGNISAVRTHGRRDIRTCGMVSLLSRVDLPPIQITFICVERSRRSRNDGTQQL